MVQQCVRFNLTPDVVSVAPGFDFLAALAAAIVAAARCIPVGHCCALAVVGTLLRARCTFAALLYTALVKPRIWSGPNVLQLHPPMIRECLSRATLNVVRTLANDIVVGMLCKTADRTLHTVVHSLVALEISVDYIPHS